MKLTKSVAVFHESGGATTVESVADILEREIKPLIEEWFRLSLFQLDIGSLREA